MRCWLPLSLLALAVAGAAEATIINTSVKRVVDLTKHVVRIHSDIQFVNDDADTSVYEFALSKQMSERLAFVAAKCGKIACEVVKAEGDAKADVGLYSVVLQEPLAKGEAGHVKLTSYFTRVLTPFPAEVTQTEEQLVVFEDTHVMPSPYLTRTQTTKVKLPSGRIESYSDVAPVAHKGATITYGPYENAEPFVAPSNALRVHFKNHSPFMTVTNLVKEIEVSMWGRVSVEEVYDLLHTGAKLKGGFSRFDYTAKGARGASFHELRASLPREAVNVYYRDQIGNVSTSRLRVTDTRQELELKPRFPLFGGWKTQWYLGYSVPTHAVMTRQGTTFKLEMDFSTSLEDAAVDDLTLKVILPEGSTNVQVSVPFAVDEQRRTTRQTYLDTALVGRPVVVLSKSNVVAAHNAPIQVTFEYAPAFMLHEPLLLVAGFLTFFVVCMALFRCDVRLVKPTASKKKTE
ncbi:hypothetical protein ATCC90586_000269 [Pythium insidiosum]|nr:hypothetical protein ATCC90586_000269 [Pythium insidiosum]